MTRELAERLKLVGREFARQNLMDRDPDPDGGMEVYEIGEPLVHQDGENVIVDVTSRRLTVPTKIKLNLRFKPCGHGTWNCTESALS